VIKIVVLLFGLGIGFCVGVYWGVNHPVEAKKFAEEEERQFLEAQKKLLEKIRTKLDQLAGSRTAAPTATGGRPGIVSAVPPAGARPGGAHSDPEVDALLEESQRQLIEVDRILKEAEGE
jgi:hypothetical protein